MRVICVGFDEKESKYLTQQAIDNGVKDIRALIRLRVLHAYRSGAEPVGLIEETRAYEPEKSYIAIEHGLAVPDAATISELQGTVVSTAKPGKIADAMKTGDSVVVPVGRGSSLYLALRARRRTCVRRLLLGKKHIRVWDLGRISLP